MRYPTTDVVEVGIDESGRGSLISAVVAGAAIMPPLSAMHTEEDRQMYVLIADSKKLSVTKRNTLESFIKRIAIAWGVGIVHAHEIDNTNILEATYKAMHMAIEEVISKCGQPPTLTLLVDGNRFKPFSNYPFECIVKGDANVLSIAAASILAKTAHDRIIVDLVESDPDTYNKYGLLQNMGYGTKKHMDAIREHGVTSQHRQSFALPTRMDAAM
jgi:ribonuclease HII